MDHTEYQAGMLLANRYTLVEPLPMSDAHVKAWKATDRNNHSVALKILWTHAWDGEYPAWKDIYEDMATLVDNLDLTNLPRRDQIAPWLDVVWMEDVKPTSLLLCRPFYEKSMEDKVYEAQEAIEKLKAFRAAVEYAYHHSKGTFRLVPSNIMVNGDGQWVLTDYGIRPLMKLIIRHMHSRYHVMTFEIHERLLYSMYEYSKPKTPIDVPLQLAGLYHYLRIGHGVFAGETRLPHNDFHDGGGYFKRVQDIGLAGKITMPYIQHEGERDVLEKALSLEASERYTTVDEFLSALDALQF